jgi:PIN domain nuclease of toxin-antitoxin system
MRLLLDSHVFLWAIQSPEELSETALAALQDTSNDLYVSLATLWELQIKSDLGKLTLVKLLPQMISEEVEAGRMSVLPITPDHIYALSSLPHHHRDPFDRLLIAQAQVEGATLVTKDHLIALYALATLW